MHKKIDPKDLKAVLKIKIRGLGDLNVGLEGATAPWCRLQRIGLSRIVDAPHYLGRVEIGVRQGAIRERDISAYYKSLFRRDVFPAIEKWAPECGDCFKLILHYREGLLFSVDLVDLI